MKEECERLYIFVLPISNRTCVRSKKNTNICLNSIHIICNVYLCVL